MEICLSNCEVLTDSQGKIKIKAQNNKQDIIYGTLAVLCLLSAYAFLSFDYKSMDYAAAFAESFLNIFIMFTQPIAYHFTLTEALSQLLITVSLALLTTVLGGVVALILGLLAASNLTNTAISNKIKGFVAFIRAIPTVLWVLIFAVSAGLGSVAAVIGLSFHSVGYLIKCYSEAFEEVDYGVIEALKASGANWWQIVFQAVLPASITYLLAWTFIRFEINFINAVAMGAAAGAGGIGYELFMAGNFYYNIREIGYIVYIILAFTMLLELFSNRLKAQIK